MDKQVIKFILEELNYKFYQDTTNGYFLPKIAKMKPNTPITMQKMEDLFNLLEKKSVVERVVEVVTPNKPSVSENEPEKKPKGWHLRKENRK